MTNVVLTQENILTTLATGCSLLPRESCRTCGSLLFRGFAELLEIKCRSCKSMNVFTGGECQVYHVKPY